tara:strand:- start:14073 stop:14390 length:318 start_codon:yes stop_codon:yes gene_type:complete
MAFAKLAGRFAEILVIIEQLVEIAEAEFTEVGSGAEKRAFVIGSINEDVNVPFLFSEAREGELIGVLVDAVVGLYNRGRLFTDELVDEVVDEATDAATAALKDMF